MKGKRIVKSTAGKGFYQWDYQEFLYLVYAFSRAKNTRELLNLFLDLLTRREISEIIRRLIIASMLERKKTYRDIHDAAGASGTTITRVHQKFFREKSILTEILERSDSFEQFNKKINQEDTRDWLTKMIDKKIYYRSLGILGKP